MIASFDVSRVFKDMEQTASPAWNNVPHVQQIAQLGLQMRAALELVLLFHKSSRWNEECMVTWQNLQVDAGMEEAEVATTKGLCNVIRHVLGKPPTQPRGV